MLLFCLLAKCKILKMSLFICCSVGQEQRSVELFESIDDNKLEEFFEPVDANKFGNFDDIIEKKELVPQPSDCVEPEPGRIRKNGKCNLRKSLAWDSAFFTSEGMLT